MNISNTDNWYTVLHIDQPDSLYLHGLRRLSNFGRLPGLNNNTIGFIDRAIPYWKSCHNYHFFSSSPFCNNRGKITERYLNFPASSLCYDWYTWMTLWNPVVLPHSVSIKIWKLPSKENPPSTTLESEYFLCPPVHCPVTGFSTLQSLQ